MLLSSVTPVIISPPFSDSNSEPIVILYSSHIPVDGNCEDSIFQEYFFVEAEIFFTILATVDVEATVPFEHLYPICIFSIPADVQVIS